MLFPAFILFMLGLPVVSGTSNAVSKDFLDYLDVSVLLPCENSEVSGNRSALVQCIRITYHVLKKSGFNNKFKNLHLSATDQLEGYFVGVVQNCSDDSISHSEFNDCIRRIYFAKYNFTLTENNVVSEKFLDYLRINLLIPCENDPDVQSNNRSALINCITENYRAMKATDFNGQFPGFDAVAFDRLEGYFEGVVLTCSKLDDTADHAKFNMCIRDEYYLKYGYSKRRLARILSQILKDFK